MVSLRTVHLVFILVVMICADLFGAWALNEYYTSRSGVTLLLGVASLLVGLGLVAYAYVFVRKMDAAHIQ